MPVTPIPEEWLSAKIIAMQRQLDELSRAVGRPNDQVRDQNDNVVHMVPGAEYPVLGAKGQDISLTMANGAVAVTDGNGRDPRPLAASQFTGPVTGDTTGVHHGDVGTPTEAHSHYGDLHGNSYGFHFGPVGDGTTQNQINALNVFATGFFGNIGIPGQNWTLYGNVVAPSERGLKADVRAFPEAGAVVDAAPSARWRWGSEAHDDGEEHAGPMVDDIAEVAPWLVRRHEDTDIRSLGDRDLIGVLWEALREARQRISVLERNAS
jgi:hypothetical protein